MKPVSYKQEMGGKQKSLHQGAPRRVLPRIGVSTRGYRVSVRLLFTREGQPGGWWDTWALPSEGLLSCPASAAQSSSQQPLLASHHLNGP